MIIRVPPNSTHDSSEAWAIDFRERAPGLAHTKMYVDDPYSSKFGGLSVAVPGELRGLEEAHRRWGKLPWKRLVMPSVELARGWKVDRELARRIQVGRSSLRNEICIDPLLDLLFLDAKQPRLLRDIRTQRSPPS